MLLQGTCVLQCVAVYSTAMHIYMCLVYSTVSCILLQVEVEYTLQ